MREVNEHVKAVMGIPSIKKPKKDYTTPIVWTILIAVTTCIWSLIYYLFNY